ncbi:MAG: hypothetical protein JWM21_1225 [Acidobacteria bacterium]|nr:hypothetical protein [Acidobacteriota bacterium]
MLMKSFRSFYIKYLFLLILSVVPFVSAQDTKLPPDVRLSEGSKLDQSQAGLFMNECWYVSLRSRRQHKAWGARPRSSENEEFQTCEAGDSLSSLKAVARSASS